MLLTTNDVKKIAYLARLGIEDHDLEAFTHDLSNMLNLMTQMNSINTDEVEPMAHPLPQSQRLRADNVTETNQREHFQHRAPHVEDGVYLVPKVIE